MSLLLVYLHIRYDRREGKKATHTYNSGIQSAAAPAK